MAEVELVDNDHNIYWCHSCEELYEGYPREGWWVIVSDYSPQVDSDGDAFFERDEKPEPKIRRGWACHGSTFCFLSDTSDFTVVVCQMYRCTACGTEYTFDNDYCYKHGFDDETEAKRAAEQCCRAQPQQKQEPLDPQLARQLLANGVDPDEPLKFEEEEKQPGVHVQMDSDQMAKFIQSFTTAVQNAADARMRHLTVSNSTTVTSVSVSTVSGASSTIQISEA